MFTWQSPSSRLVLTAALDTLAELGWDALTVDEVRSRAGSAGAALDDKLDLEALVIAALEHVDLFPAPQPTGDLRRDLRRLLDPWRTAPGPQERIVAALLSPAVLRPRLRVAVYEALDGPLNRNIAAVLAHAHDWHDIPPGLVQTLCWVLRGLLVDRLRSGPRSAVDLDLLADFLMAGVQGRTQAGGPRPSAPEATAEGALR